MLTCCPCTKGLVKEITNHFKATMSLKPLRVQRPRKAGSAEEAAAMDEAGEEGIGGGQEEWVAEPETGVLITLVPLPSGGNYVKKIRFSKEVFDDCGAQKWWSENYDKIMELYSIASCQSSSTRAPSEDDDDDGDAGGDLTNSIQVQEEAESGNDALCSSESSGCSSKPQKKPQLAPDDAEIQAKVLEWVVEDEPGVFVTVRSMPNGSKEILRVELSREMYGEVKARVWWEENKLRLQKQYS